MEGAVRSGYAAAEAILGEKSIVEDVPPTTRPGWRDVSVRLPSMFSGPDDKDGRTHPVQFEDVAFLREHDSAWRLLRADHESHPDLFWAIRGGGGNFGVATRFQFRLHEVDTVLGGMLILPATAEVVASFIAEADAAPEELSGMINVAPAPPMPFVPAEHHGRPIIMAVLAYAGAADAGERVLAPLRALAAPIVDQIRPMRYRELYEGPEGPHPARITVRSLFVDSIDRSTAQLALDRLLDSSAPMRVAQFRILGGAVARIPVDATAFAHRSRRIMATVAAAYELPEEAAEHAAWASSFAAELRSGAPAAYVGFLGDEVEALVREAYPGPTCDRLREINQRYDPTNLFRLNQNVPPAR
jgi:FAD/FMN-containing dehydrogenase